MLLKVFGFAQGCEEYLDLIFKLLMQIILNQWLCHGYLEDLLPVADLSLGTIGIDRVLQHLDDVLEDIVLVSVRTFRLFLGATRWNLFHLVRMGRSKLLLTTLNFVPKIIHLDELAKAIGNLIKCMHLGEHLLCLVDGFLLSFVIVALAPSHLVLILLVLLILFAQLIIIQLLL